MTSVSSIFRKWHFVTFHFKKMPQLLKSWKRLRRKRDRRAEYGNYEVTAHELNGDGQLTRTPELGRTRPGRMSGGPRDRHRSLVNALQMTQVDMVCEIRQPL